MARILIVDDEKSIRITIQAFLVNEGHDAQVAEEASKALELLKNEDFDVVVTDIVMPRLSGVKLLEAIREVSQHVQVILITGEPTIESASDALRLGAFDYLAKPFTKENIIKAVNSAATTKALIDDKLRLEAENLNYKQNLEQLVKDRTGELIRSEDRYRSLFENMLDAFAVHKVVLDENNKPVDYIFLEVNDTFETQTGLMREKIIGKKVTEIMPGIENDPADWIGTYGKVALTGKEIRFEQYSAPLKEWYRVLAYSPKKNHFATIFTSITEAKQAEKTLRESEELHRVLFDSSQDAMMILAPPTWSFTSGNPTTIKMFGVKNEEDFCSRPPWMYSPQFQPDGLPSADKAKEIIQTAMRDGSNFFEWVHRRADGEDFPATVLLSRIEIAGAVQLQATVRDVTKSKRAEEKIKESREFLDSIINGIADPIFVKDEKHRWIAFNDTFCELLGCPRSEILGKSDYDLLPKEEADVFWTHDEIVLSSDKIDINEEYITAGGQKRVVSTIKSSFTNPITGKKNLVGTIRDITDRKQLEQDLKFERDNLETNVEQRTWELEEALYQIERVNKLLKAADHHKSQFLSSMSHELRTPLNAIIGFTDLLHGKYYGDLNEKQMGYVKFVQEAGRHLLALISDLLDIAKIDAGSVQLDLTDVIIEDIINSSISMVNPAVKKNKIIIEQEIEANIGVVHADLRRSKQILLNLLSNAVKFSPVGESIKIRVSKKDESNALFEVIDNGVGIESDQQIEIFSEFYQIEHVRDEQLGGTGIGLALTKRLVELHRGEVGVESEIGVGSRFWFTLPLKIQDS